MKLHDTTDIILHIGMPKTGSSAIQKFCLENPKKLAQYGIYYPKHSIDKNGVSGGHDPLFHLVNDKRLDDARAFILDALKVAKKKGHVLLLSNEGSHLFFNEYNTILKGLQVQVIGFFRAPVDSLFSAYNQMIKRHYNTEALLEYTNKSLRSSKPILAGQTLIGWTDTFADNVTIFPYSKDAKSHQSVLYQFLKFLRFDDSDINAQSLEQRINSGYSHALLEFKRLFNYVLNHEDKKLNHEIDMVFQKLSDQGVYSTHTLESTLSDKVLANLVAKFASSVQLIESQHQFSFSAFTNISKSEPYSPFRALEESLKIIQYLKSQEKSLYKKMKSKVMKQKWTAVNADQSKLMSLFDIDGQHISHYRDSFFSPQSINNLAQSQEVDLFRELSVLFRDRGDFKTANALIDRALILRPSGPVIKQIKESIVAELSK